MAVIEKVLSLSLSIDHHWNTQLQRTVYVTLDSPNNIPNKDAFLPLICLTTQGLNLRGDRQWDQSQVILADIHQHSDCCWQRQHPPAQHASKWERQREGRGEWESEAEKPLQPKESHEVTLQDRMHGLQPCKLYTNCDEFLRFIFRTKCYFAFSFLPVRTVCTVSKETVTWSAQEIFSLDRFIIICTSKY